MPSDTNASPVPTILSFREGAYTADFATLPLASQMALARRGFAHLLGNEVSSKVTAFKGKKIGEGEAARDPTDDEIEAFAKTATSEMLSKLLAGTLGERVPGALSAPKLTPIEKMMERIAVENITTALATIKLTIPRGDKVVSLNGQDFTRAQLIERQLRNKGDAIRHEAEKRLKAEARAIAKAAEAAKSAPEGVSTADALGL